jgi:hypothetical protein
MVSIKDPTYFNNQTPSATPGVIIPDHSYPSLGDKNPAFNATSPEDVHMDNQKHTAKGNHYVHPYRTHYSELATHPCGYSIQPSFHHPQQPIINTLSTSTSAKDFRDDVLLTVPTIKRKPNTDALAAAALCELHRGDDSESR